MKDYNSKIGTQKFILSDVDSTNNFAAKLINDGLGVHGSVIMAENQTNGRGQQGALWQSNSKLNLLVLVDFDLQLNCLKSIPFVSIGMFRFVLLNF